MYSVLVAYKALHRLNPNSSQRGFYLLIGGLTLCLHDRSPSPRRRPTPAISEEWQSINMHRIQPHDPSDHPSARSPAKRISHLFPARLCFLDQEDPPWRPGPWNEQWPRLPQGFFRVCSRPRRSPRASSSCRLPSPPSPSQAALTLPAGGTRTRNPGARHRRAAAQVQGVHPPASAGI